MTNRDLRDGGSEMRCRDVEEALAINMLTQSVRAHIEECKSCQELTRVLELLSGDAQMDSIQIGRLQKLIVDDLRPVRPMLPSRPFVLAFALIFVGLGALGVSYLGTHGWFVLMPGQRVAVFLTLAASAALLTFSLVKQMVPGHKSLLRPELLPAAVFVLLCSVVATVFRIRVDPHFLEAGKACLRAGVPYAIPAPLVFWLILRRGAILSPRLVGAVAGMLAALVSTTVLEMSCSNLDVRHILLWHFGIAPLGMVTGLFIAMSDQAIRNRI